MRKTEVKTLTLLISVVMIISFTVTLTGCLGPGKEVKIIYDGSWRGEIEDDDGSRSVSGYGTESFEVSGRVHATAEKTDGDIREITIQIIENDEVVEEDSTTEPYGKVSVTG
ncbi:MAG: hypothetical protein KGY66_07795 [Candidatus Thermoplasmatota archaeon]|nr:hypothetical protein [Candidatus Thermoplasmatota archaeon]MBS3790801.1 hypothetical protein [Candidatus Thermoplasmatota archaeon]